MNDLSFGVFLVDDDPAVRDSLSLLLESEGHVVRSFESASDFLAACSTKDTGCAIIDLRMPAMDGIQLQAEMKRRGIRLPIIFLTGYGDIPTSVKAIKAGAVDFLTKPVTGDDLRASIAAALAISRQQANDESRDSSTESRLATLTEREHAVMKLAVSGFSNKEIARQLGISHRTVEIHKAHMMRKTGASTLIDLVRMTGRMGPER